MNIIVCVKQTYDLQQVRIRKETRQPVLENVPLTLGNIDKNALEEAVRIKEKSGGKITVLSVGPESLEDTIKEALAMGADEAVLVTRPGIGLDRIRPFRGPAGQSRRSGRSVMT